VNNIVKEVIPYTTKTGVQIGLLYLPPNKYEADFDATLIQKALIYKPKTAWQKFKHIIGVRYDDYVL
jgi:hypothetical protein